MLLPSFAGPLSFCLCIHVRNAGKDLLNAFRSLIMQKWEILFLDFVLRKIAKQWTRRAQQQDSFTLSVLRSIPLIYNTYTSSHHE